MRFVKLHSECESSSIQASGWKLSVLIVMSTRNGDLNLLDRSIHLSYCDEACNADQTPEDSLGDLRFAVKDCVA